MSTIPRWSAAAFAMITAFALGCSGEGSGCGGQTPQAPQGQITCPAGTHAENSSTGGLQCVK